MNGPENPFDAPKVETTTSPESASFDTPRRGVEFILALLLALEGLSLLFVLEHFGSEVDASLGRSYLGLMVFIVLLYVLAAAAWCFWIYRAAQNAEALAPGDEVRFTPAGAVWCHFVPVWNLFQPALVVASIVRRSRSLSDDAPGLPQLLVPAWWIAWLSSVALGVVAGVVEIDAPVFPMRVSVWDGVEEMSSLLTTLLALIVVRRLNEHQTLSFGEQSARGEDAAKS